MPKPTIGIISDLAWTEGVGRYGIYLQRLLGNEFDIDLIYFDYQRRQLELTKDGLTRLIAGTRRIPILDNKPWFWLRLRGAIPRYNLLHLITQNISFLVPSDGRAFVTCHDVAPLLIPGSPWTRRARKALYSGLPRTRLIGTDSESTRNDLVRILKIDPERIRVIPLGVDLTVFRPEDKGACRRALNLAEDRRIILNVGIDKWRKNVRGLLNMLAILVQRIPKVTLVRIGKPSPETLSLIRTLALEMHVRHVGFCEDRDLVQYYNAADIFAFPSLYEGFGLPPLEAMACGTPVISSDRSSLPEVMGDASVLLDPEDSPAWASQLERVLTDDAFAHRLSEAGRRRAQQLTWDCSARATAELYRTLLQS